MATKRNPHNHEGTDLPNWPESDHKVATRTCGAATSRVGRQLRKPAFMCRFISGLI